MNVRSPQLGSCGKNGSRELCNRLIIFNRDIKVLQTLIDILNIDRLKLRTIWALGRGNAFNRTTDLTTQRYNLFDLE